MRCAWSWSSDFTIDRLKLLWFYSISLPFRKWSAFSYSFVSRFRLLSGHSWWILRRRTRWRISVYTFDRIAHEIYPIVDSDLFFRLTTSSKIQWIVLSRWWRCFALEHRGKRCNQLINKEMRLSLPWKPNQWTEAGILKSLVKVEKVNFSQKKVSKS